MSDRKTLNGNGEKTMTIEFVNDGDHINVIARGLEVARIYKNEIFGKKNWFVSQDGSGPDYYDLDGMNSLFGLAYLKSDIRDVIRNS